MIYFFGKSIPSALFSRVRRAISVVPPSWKMGRHYRYWMRFLPKCHKWNDSEIEAWQLRRFQTIVRHAYDNTEGYRDLYRTAGIGPNDIQNLEDIRHLPFTTKQLFQENVEAFSTRAAIRRYVTTGGSTGIPFGFYNEPKNQQIENAFMHTAYASVGFKAGMKCAVLRGAFVGSETNTWNYDIYTRNLLLSSYYLTAQKLDGYIEVIRRYGTRVLRAYPSSLMIFADLLADTGQLDAIGFDLILLGSENIYDWQIARFREAFPRARIFAWYGHAEKAIFAPWGSNDTIYHSSPFYGITEVLNGANSEVRPSESGELVGTSFHNFMTPFIRYRTMDYAVKGESGVPGYQRSYVHLTSILGRSQEFIVTGRGRYISMTAVNMHDDIFDQLRQFQFFQNTPGKVVFRYVPKCALDAAAKADIQRRLQIKLGEDVELSLIEVGAIPPTRSGKFRFLDQQMAIQYGDRDETTGCDRSDSSGL